MVGRRMGSLVVSVVVISCTASCRGSIEREAQAQGAPVPDTVELPDMLAELSAPLIARSDAVSGAEPAADAVVVTEPATTEPPATEPATSEPPTTEIPTTETSATGQAQEPETALLMASAGNGPAAAHPTVELRQATLDFTGDTLVHSPLVNRARANAGGNGYDFAPMFARVAPILSAADLAVCHLESGVAPVGQPLSTYPLYGIPPQIADGLATAGYDRCSTASNHTIDRGTAGIDATVEALERAGLSQAGMARTPDEAVATLVEANGVTVAHLSYTYGFNGAHLPRDEPWRSNLIDVANIVAAAADARARGADVVVLNLHWGTEGSSDVNRQQREVAEAITSAGAVDLIVGEHAHVIQPIEQVNGTWVVFGMGNFLSNMPTGTFPAKTQDGMIVSVSFREQPDGTFAVDRPVVIPTWVDRRDGFVIRPVLADLADPSVSAATKDALYASLQRTGAVVGGFVAG